MIYFALIFSIFTAFISIRKLNLLAPINIFNIFNILQIYTYIIVLRSNIDIQLTEKFAIPTLYLIKNNYFEACLVFIYFSILILFFSLFNFSDTQEIKKIKFSSNQFLFSGFIDTFFKFLVIATFLINLIFIFDINLNKLILYEGYLQLHNPEFLGADFYTSRIFSRTYGFLAIILIPINFIHKGNIFFKIINYFNLIFLFLFAFIMASRVLPLLFFILFVCTIIFRKNKINFIVLIIYSILIFLSFIIILELRSSQFLGISRFFDSLNNIDNFYYNFSKIFFNLTQGMVALDLSLGIDAQYPLKHKILSLIPSITLIDNFDLYYNAYLYRISVYNPLPAYGELIHYGVIYFILATFVFVWILNFISKSFKKSGYDILYSPVLMIAYLNIFKLSQYNVRNSVKFIFASLIITIIINRILKKNETN